MIQCWQNSEMLRTEFDAWSQQAQQLTQMAVTFGGDVAGDLITKMEHVRSLAVSLLQVLGTLSVDSDDDAAETNELRLRELCDAVLALLDASDNHQSALTNVFPSFMRSFGVCQPPIFAMLRDELRQSTQQSESLLKLADKHCGPMASKLARNVRLAHSRIGRVVDVFEELHDLARLKPDIGASAGRDATTDSEDVLLHASPSRELQHRLDMANRSFRRGNFSLADRLYSDALSVDPNCRTGLLQRGRTRIALEQLELAVVDFTRLLDIDPTDSVAVKLRGDVYSLLEQYELALADYDLACNLSPESFVARYNRAVVYRQSGDHKRARKEFVRLAEQQPKSASIPLNLGLIWIAEGSFEAARGCFQRALALQPNCAEARDWLAKLDAEESPPSHEISTPPRRQSASAVTPQKVSTDRVDVSKERLAAEKVTSLPMRELRSSEDASSKAASSQDQSDDRKQPNQSLPAGDDLALSFLLSDLREEQDESSQRPTATPRATATEVERTSNSQVDIPTAEVISQPSTKPSFTKPVDAPSSPQPNSRQHDWSGEGLSAEDSTKLELSCPKCDALCFMSWNKLKPGKVLQCPQCETHLTLGPSGHLMELVKSKQGQWTAVKPKRADWNWPSMKVMAAIVACIILVALPLIWPSRSTEAVVNDPALPTELEPRASAFAVAWLKGDFRTLRRLTPESHASSLYLWCMEHPTPIKKVTMTLERDLVLKVVIQKSSDETARVTVHMEGIPTVAGATKTNLDLLWKQDGEVWVFQPFSQIAL